MAPPRLPESVTSPSRRPYGGKLRRALGAGVAAGEDERAGALVGPTGSVEGRSHLQQRGRFCAGHLAPPQPTDPRGAGARAPLEMVVAALLGLAVNAQRSRCASTARLIDRTAARPRLTA